MRNRNLAAGLLAAASIALLAAPAAAWTVPGTFNKARNILISDQFNNRVIEVDPQGQIVWSWGLGPNDVSANSVIGVNDAERVGRDTLLAGTGAPPGSEPLCPNGCPDNRVMLVDPNGKILWQYGKFGVTGSGHDQLNTPVQATWTPDRTVFITDQVNERVIEVNMDKKILWQYGMTGVSGSGFDQLNNPNSAELLKNGHILIADENNNRAIEVDRAKNIVATFTIGGTASGVAFASRLQNGQTLITDSNNNRVVAVDSNDHILWEYFTNKQKNSNSSPLPTRGLRTKDGDIVISDQFNHRVIVVNMEKKIETQYGHLNRAGYGTTSTDQGLNAPYDAKVIGDYTGLTSP